MKNISRKAKAARRESARRAQDTFQVSASDVFDKIDERFNRQEEQ